MHIIGSRIAVQKVISVSAARSPTETHKRHQGIPGKIRQPAIRERDNKSTSRARKGDETRGTKPQAAKQAFIQAVQREEANRRLLVKARKNNIFYVRKYETTRYQYQFDFLLEFW